MSKATISGIILAGCLLVAPAICVYAQQTCPEGSMLSQTPTSHVLPALPRIWGSDELIDYIVSLGAYTYDDLPYPLDDFSVSGPIGEIVWWGTELDLTLNPAERYAPLFTITFYENDTVSYPDPMPGAVANQYSNLLVSKVDTGIRYINPNTYLFELPLYRYSVELPTPCVMSEGWISIKGALGGSVDPLDPTNPDKARVLVQLSSSVGNENLREFDGVNLPYRVRIDDRHDISVCLVEAEVIVTVPDVVGDASSAAQDAIVAAGLTVGTITYDYSGQTTAGQVVSQNPAAGTEVSGGTAVNLVVAADPSIVPYVVGMTQSAAATALVNAGLTVGTVTMVYSDTAPADQVIQQGTAADTAVAPGTAVNLVVSRGPEPQVPVTGVPALIVLTAALAGLGAARYRRNKR